MAYARNIDSEGRGHVIRLYIKSCSEAINLLRLDLDQRARAGSLHFGEEGFPGMSG